MDSQEIIKRITDKDRLIKLYECEECSDGLQCDKCNNQVCDRRDTGIDCIEHACSKCDAKGYTINRDSQVLDIVDSLIKTRDTINIKPYGFYASFHKYPAQALIKLIELAEGEEREALPRNESLNNCEYKNIDSDINVMIAHVSVRVYEMAYNSLLSFCRYHKIDIWQSVAEILEGEK